MKIAKSSTIYLFPGCVTELFSRVTVTNSINFIRKLGYSTVLAPTNLCCGQIAWNAGSLHITKDISSSFLNWLKLLPKTATVVSLSASCVSFINKYLTSFTALPRIRLLEYSQFLYQSMEFQNWRGELNASVALHVSCHHLRDLDQGFALNQILKKINGLNLLPFLNPELCCGFGGIFSLVFPELSNALTSRKLNGLPKNASYLTSADLSCLWKLNQVLKKTHPHIKVVHFADLLYYADLNQRN